jgi:hypothetical protein
MARKAIKWGSISLVIMALIPGSIALVKKVYLMLNPPPPPAPTVRYGKLPALIFPESPSFATPEYKLETITGGFDPLPNVSKVYLVGINKSRLLVLERMTQKAVISELTEGPAQLDDRTYRYINPKFPIDMIFDVITGSFSYKFDWTSDKTVYTTFDVPIGNLAITEAKAFFQRMGVLQEDLTNGTTKVTYLAATSSAMVPANSPYEANFVRVDIFRNEKDGWKVVTVGGDTSPTNVIMCGLYGQKRVVQGNYYYSQVVGEDFATYPLKTAADAWKELVSGGGFIAKRTIENKVVVRRATLAYFESNEQQGFLQPVYVFEGDGGFMAYVQAVDSQYVTTIVAK